MRTGYPHPIGRRDRRQVSRPGSPVRRRRGPGGRQLGRLAAVALACLALVLAVAGPAGAHTTLLFSNPAADGTVPTAPASITLIFDQPIGLTANTVRLSDANGRGVLVGRAAPIQGGRGVTAVPGSRLTSGVYTVTWQVLARDGDVMGGDYRFAVGPAAAALTGGRPGGVATKGLWPAALLRWLLFAGLAGYLGGLAADRLCRRRRATTATEPLPEPPRPWLLPAALTGLAASVGLAALITGDGALISGLARLSPGELVADRAGVLAAVELAGFGLAAVAALTRRPAWGAWPLAAVIGAEALRAHPHSAQAGWGALATVVHLTAAAVWAGALIHVLRTVIAWHAAPRAGRMLLGAYARLALWLFVLVVAAGTAAAVLVVPIGSLLTTAYGRVLLAKIALVAVASGLALAARQRLRPAANPSRGPLAPARVEAITLVGVLGLTGLLTALPTPRSPGQALAFPPPAAGDVVPAGTLAGQIGISARASTGQLVLQLSTPDVDPGEASADGQRYQLSAIAAEPGGVTGRLALHECGTGCFYTSLQWPNGTTRLTLQAAAAGWTGGAASLAIAWPPRPDPQLLRTVVTAMNAVPRLTVHELVTSDTSRGIGTPKTISITGSRFLASEPYGGGRAPVTTRLASTPSHTRLALAYPADNLQLELTLTPDGRILRETLAAPNHLVTRSFDYPPRVASTGFDLGRR